MSFLIDFCIDYRTYLHVCWQLSSTLFSIIISSFYMHFISICLNNLSFLEAKTTSPTTMCPAHVWHNCTIYLSPNKYIFIVSWTWFVHLSLKYFRVYSSYLIVYVGWLAYHLWKNFHPGQTTWNTKEKYCERQQN